MKLFILFLLCLGMKLVYAHDQNQDVSICKTPFLIAFQLLNYFLQNLMKFINHNDQSFKF